MKPTPAHHPVPHDAVDALIAYHDRTKHHPERYARGPGGLDWANQPDPFRRYSGSPVFRLPLVGQDDTPASGVLFGTESSSPRQLTLGSLGLLFELSLGLSARKEIAGSGWYLRTPPLSLISPETNENGSAKAHRPRRLSVSD